MSANPNQGLRKNARSPGSISNAQHHDPSGAEKSLNGIPATIQQVVATSTTKTPLEQFALLWVVNRDTAVQYIFVGKDSDVPLTVSATNGMALPAGEGVLLHCGASDDDLQSMAVKSSNALVHVTILQS